MRKTPSSHGICKQAFRKVATLLQVDFCMNFFLKFLLRICYLLRYCKDMSVQTLLYKLNTTPRICIFRKDFVYKAFLKSIFRRLYFLLRLPVGRGGVGNFPCSFWC